MSELIVQDKPHEIVVSTDAGESRVDKARYRRIATTIASGRGMEGLEDSFVCAQLGVIEAASRKEEAGRARLLELIKRRQGGKNVTAEELYAARRAMSEGSHVKELAVAAIEAYHATLPIIEREARI